jgi:hypothetical protein
MNIKQPVSVWTCAAYLIIGFLAAGKAAVDIFLFLSFTYLAVASAGFHWTRSRHWQKADESSMYTVFWAIIVSFLTAWYPENYGWIFTACIAAPVIMTVYHERINTFPGVGILFWVSWVLFLSANSWAISLIVLFVFAAAYLFRAFGDDLRAWYSGDPNENEDPLHGVWHVGNALGFYLMLFPPF